VVAVVGPALGALVVGALVLTLTAAPANAAEERPTILLVVTDDQRWDTMWAMPLVRAGIAERGVTFENAFVTNPLCCPSRASILTGQYSHSTMVYRNVPPYGRAEWFRDGSTVATWLDDAGYTTGFFGKYLDGFQQQAVTGYVPPGWDRWAAFVHSEYYTYGLSVDGSVRGFQNSVADYSTDVLADLADRFIRSRRGPLFLVFAPAAPHAPAIPHLRDLLAFPNLPPARPPSFNEADVSDKPAWLRAQRPLTPLDINVLDSLRGDQHRSLLSVDRAVDGLLRALGETGRLANSLVIYTSDNGISWGEHRWTRKESPYEENVRVPLMIRYGGVAPAGGAESRFALNIDLAPTIADAAGVPAPGAEGRSLMPLLRGEQDVPWRTDFLIEHLRGANPVSTYCAVRTGRHLYAEYETGERELYDLLADPFQLNNVAGDAASASLVRRFSTRLDTLCWPPPPGLRQPPGDRQDVAAMAALLLVGAVVLGRRNGFNGGRTRRRPPGSRSDGRLGTS
jgi:N-acetylglucosamine-6-sulfatase